MRLCSVASGRSSSLSASTSSLTLSPWSRLSTSTASWVDTTVTSSTPTTAVSRSSERMWTFFGVEGDAVAMDGVAVGVVGAELPHRVPIADVRPADVGRHHRGALGALHHRIVDRLLRRALERRLVEDEKAEVLARRRRAPPRPLRPFPARRPATRTASRRRGRRNCPSSTDSLPLRSAWRSRRLGFSTKAATRRASPTPSESPGRM